MSVCFGFVPGKRSCSRASQLDVPENFFPRNAVYGLVALSLVVIVGLAVNYINRTPSSALTVAAPSEQIRTEERPRLDSPASAPDAVPLIRRELDSQTGSELAPDLMVTSGLPARLQEVIQAARANGDVVWAKAVEMAWTDFPAAAKMLREGPPARYGERLAGLLGLIGGEDLNKLAENLPLLGDMNLRSTAVSTASSAWARRNPQQLLDFASTVLTGELRNRAMSSVVRELIRRKDFTAAAGAFDQVPGSNERASLLGELASAKSEQDVWGALNWATRFASPEDRRAVEYGIFSKAVATMGLDDAAKVANELTDTRAKQNAISTIASKLADTDINQAIQFAAGAPPDVRKIIEPVLAGKMAGADVNRATGYALRMADPEAKKTALNSIASVTVRDDPQRALAWFATLDQEMQSTLASGMATKVYGVDTNAAYQWATGIPPGKVRDGALLGLVNRTTWSDPTGAMQLARQMSDPALRDQTILRLGSNKQ